MLNWDIAPARWTVGLARRDAPLGKWAVGPGKWAVGLANWNVALAKWAVALGKRAVALGKWAPQLPRGTVHFPGGASHFGRRTVRPALATVRFQVAAAASRCPTVRFQVSASHLRVATVPLPVPASHVATGDAALPGAASRLPGGTVHRRVAKAPSLRGEDPFRLVDAAKRGPATGPRYLVGAEPQDAIKRSFVFPLECQYLERNYTRVELAMKPKSLAVLEFDNNFETGSELCKLP